LSVFFLDTSALAKRYIGEVGSNWIRSWILPKMGNTIIISRLATVEMISLMVRKQREGIVSLEDFRRNRNNFLLHLRNQYEVIELEPRVLATARALIIRYPLRTLDAIHLASALQAKMSFAVELTFVCADIRLSVAAAAEGLPTNDPNAHP
jgi:uncharacterized protein